MKVISDRPTKEGGRRVTVSLAPGEKLVAIKEESYYRMGGPMDDVVQGHYITGATGVCWCSLSQEWVPA